MCRNATLSPALQEEGVPLFGSSVFLVTSLWPGFRRMPRLSLSKELGCTEVKSYLPAISFQIFGERLGEFSCRQCSAKARQMRFIFTEL